MARMQVLNPTAQKAFDSPPTFDHRERQSAFDFSSILVDLAQTLRHPAYQVMFLVGCGYFKACKRFFPSNSFHQRDLEYVAHKLSVTDVTGWNYPDRARQRHQKMILEFYGFRPFDTDAANSVEVEIATMARQHLKPRLIFERCTDFLLQQKYQLPKARTLIELIRIGLQARKAELVEGMNEQLGDNARALLDGLFTIEQESSRYRLTLLKRISQSIKPTQIKETVADFETVSEIFKQLEPSIDVLDLSPAGIQYFAQGVLKSEIFQLQRRSDGDRYIHATAFINHQLFRLGDTLIDQLLSAMASFQTTAARQYKERMFEQRNEQTARLKTVVVELDQSAFVFRNQVQALTDDADLTDSQKVKQIRGLLEIDVSSNFEQLKADMFESGDEPEWHDLLERQSRRLQNKISPILRALDFEANARSHPLAKAITQFKDDLAPCLDFLSDQERTALTPIGGQFRLSLYKVFLFQHVAAAVKAGNLNLAWLARSCIFGLLKEQMVYVSCA